MNPDYSVQIELPCSLIYQEGERVMVIGGDVGAGRCAFVFRRSDVRGWSPPHEAEVVDGAERLRVIENIRAAYAWAGKEVVAE